MTAAERGKLRGVSAPRAPQILAGAILADRTMAALDIESVEVCPWALREGIVLLHLESMARIMPCSLQPVDRRAQSDDRSVRRLSLSQS